MKFLISYDLRSDYRDRPALNKELEELGAKRVLRSQWVIQTPIKTAREVYNLIEHHFDEDVDRVLICPLYLNSSVHLNLMPDSE